MADSVRFEDWKADDWKLSLAAQVKSLRRAQSMTARELADAAGISERGVDDLENGLGAYDLWALEQIAEALGATVNISLK